MKEYKDEGLQVLIEGVCVDINSSYAVTLHLVDICGGNKASD